jgi:hypothetical protein
VERLEEQLKLEEEKGRALQGKVAKLNKERIHIQKQLTTKDKEVFIT